MALNVALMCECERHYLYGMSKVTVARLLGIDQDLAAAADREDEADGDWDHAPQMAETLDATFVDGRVYDVIQCSCGAVMDPSLSIKQRLHHGD